MLSAILSFIMLSANSNIPYTITADILSTPKPLEAVYHIHIRPHDGWLLKTSTPFQAKIIATDLIIEHPIFNQKDLPNLKTPIKAKKKGIYGLQTSILFFLCSKNLCKKF